jgi:hypothetical protein
MAEPTVWEPNIATVAGDASANGTAAHSWCEIPPEWGRMVDGLEALGYEARVTFTRDPRSGAINGVLIGRRKRAPRRSDRFELTDKGRAALRGVAALEELEKLYEAEGQWDDVPDEVVPDTDTLPLFPAPTRGVA